MIHNTVINQHYFDFDLNLAPCFQGTYSTNGECEACPIGTYQDEIAQTNCKACPNGTSTQQIGSANSTACKGKPYI